MKNKSLHVVASIARTLLGITFIFSGFVKAVDPLGTTYKIEDYLKAFGGFFTNLLPMAEVAAIGLITFEFVLGICLLCNVKSKVCSWLALLMMLFMTPLTLYVALTNPVSDCGCFGDAVVISNWATFWKNVVLLTLVIVFMVFKKHVPQTFVNAAEWGIIGLAIVLVGGFMTYNLTHLPVIDFRPYKVGNNIPALMEYPEDAAPDVYDTKFIYAKDGVEEEFTLENYLTAKNDSAYVFVRQESKLISKGYEPPIHDFELINEDGEDLTWDILESEEPVYLVVMYDLKKANKSFAAKINDLPSPVYILTGSSDEDIDLFRTEVGLYQPFCFCDPVTLKTIVRANPGVCVVQHGQVIEKFNLRNK